MKMKTVKYEIAGSLSHCEREWLEAIAKEWLAASLDADPEVAADECLEEWFRWTRERIEVDVESERKWNGDTAPIDEAISEAMHGYVPNRAALVQAMARYALTHHGRGASSRPQGDASSSAASVEP